MRRDTEDLVWFIAEGFRLQLLANPLLRRLVGFHQSTEVLTDHSTPDARINAIRTALHASDLSFAEQEFATFEQEITRLIDGTFDEIRKDAERVFPQYAARLPSIQRLDDIVYYHQDAARKIIRGSSTELATLRQHWRQLKDFFPRFEEIMSRSFVWDFIGGVAAAWFAGPIGVVGAHVWEGWRAASDEEFMQKFGSAAEQFDLQSRRFLENLEIAFRPAVRQLAEDVRLMLNEVASLVDWLARQGVDTRVIYAEYRRQTEDLDADCVRGLEMIVSSLREQGLSREREQNLRQLLGIAYI
jgi:hypothetical protein